MVNEHASRARMFNIVVALVSQRYGGLPASVSDADAINALEWVMDECRAVRSDIVNKDDTGFAMRPPQPPAPNNRKQQDRARLLPVVTLENRSEMAATVIRAVKSARDQEKQQLIGGLFGAIGMDPYDVEIDGYGKLGDVFVSDLSRIRDSAIRTASIAVGVLDHVGASADIRHIRVRDAISRAQLAPIVARADDLAPNVSRLLGRLYIMEAVDAALITEDEAMLLDEVVSTMPADLAGVVNDGF